MLSSIGVENFFIFSIWVFYFMLLLSLLSIVIFSPNYGPTADYVSVQK